MLFLRFVFGLLYSLKDPNMAHYKISDRVSHLLILYVLVFDRIHDAMYTWGTFYPCVHQTHLDCLLLKRSFFVSSDHRNQSHFKFQACGDVGAV